MTRCACAPAWSSAGQKWSPGASSTWAGSLSVVGLCGCRPREKRSRPSARAGAVPPSRRTDLQPPRAVKAPRGGSAPAGAPFFNMKSLRVPVGPPPPARLPGRTGDGFLPAPDAGRSSGLRARPGHPGFLGPTASQPGGQCASWGSFSLTAAGQPRILTEFPLSRGGRPGTSTTGTISASPPRSTKYSGLVAVYPLDIDGVWTPHMCALALREGFLFERLTASPCSLIQSIRRR